jgi:hypothetical protein
MFPVRRDNRSACNKADDQFPGRTGKFHVVFMNRLRLFHNTTGKKETMSNFPVVRETFPVLPGKSSWLKNTFRTVCVTGMTFIETKNTCRTKGEGGRGQTSEPPDSQSEVIRLL